MMASVDLFEAPASPDASLPTLMFDSMSALDVSGAADSLSLHDIKMFESLDLNSSGSSGIGNSNEAIIEGSLDEADSLLEDASQYCKICKEKLRSPRVLSCLHVFCEECIDALLNDAKDDLLDESNAIDCPECHQTTAVSGTADALPTDYALTNVLDLVSMEPGSLQCTSCKSAETAISRCNDCAHFLCASCDNAHKYMRCFENHKVVILEELRNSDEKVAIHKPIFCTVHASENLKYYCFKCEAPICNECVIGDHKGDHYELLDDSDKRLRADMDDLMAGARAKLDYCDDTTTVLGNALTELQTQHDAAYKSVADTYRRCKAALDKCHEQALQDLDRLHSERELKIMDLMHNVEKCVEKTDTACKFTTKLLQVANAAELACMKKAIAAQFLQLTATTPKVDVHFALEFVPKADTFERHSQEAFGKFRTEACAQSPKETTPPPTLPGLRPALSKPNISCNGSSQGALTGSVTASSPISLPASMQSSFDSDLQNIGTNFMMPPSALTPDSVAAPPSTMHSSLHSNGGQQLNGNNMSASSSSLQSQLSIAEINLRRLANLVDSSDMPDGIVPAPQPSPAQQHFTLADLISNERAFSNNLEALYKLGFNNDLNPASMATQPIHRPESVSLMTDYSMPSSTSPVSAITSINDNMSGMNGIGSMNGLNGINGMSGMNGINGLNMNGNSAERAKATPMHIRYKFGSLGPSRVQFNSPHGFCLGVDEEIIVADTNNHRIEIFEKDGTFKMQFGVPGKEEGQLWYPRKVAVMRSNSKFVVCDRGNERSRMQIFTKNGHFIKKIAIRYIDIVAGLAVTNEGHIVAVDSVSPTVFVISEDGDLVHWFDCSDHMREPSDIAINGTDFYVCDFKGHCVAVFGQDGLFKYRIGNEKITSFPNGIDISDAGDILIGDSHGNRFHVACFSREGVLQSEFECPHVKVSRCCGLKITSEGYVVTLAKNNHHVLVLNTLYIQ